MKISEEEIESLLCIAVAVLNPGGLLLEANAGFLRLLGVEANSQLGTKVARCFIQPNFPTLAGAVADQNGAVYQGLMTMGAYAGTTRTLRGRVRRSAKGIHVLAEYDIEEIERIGSTVQDIYSDSLLNQRALGVANAGLKNREAAMVELSTIDPLTGAGNRRRLDEVLATEIARAKRSGRPLGIVMADLDHFKRVNDTFGHGVGDKVLARFGELLRRQSRPTDIVTRFGGEEFIVLLPETDLRQATEVAERIRTALAAERIEPLPDPVTSSFGVTLYVPDETLSALLERVDAALYRAKESGRNRVEVASGQVVSD